MSRPRKLVHSFVPLLFGLVSVVNVVSRPRFAAYHGADMVQLFASGMCFGVALVLLVDFFRGRHAG